MARRSSADIGEQKTVKSKKHMYWNLNTSYNCKIASIGVNQKGAFCRTLQHCPKLSKTFIYPSPDTCRTLQHFQNCLKPSYILHPIPEWLLTKWVHTPKRYLKYVILEFTKNMPLLRKWGRFSRSIGVTSDLPNLPCLHRGHKPFVVQDPLPAGPFRCCHLDSAPKN